MTLAQLKKDAEGGKISLELKPVGIWAAGDIPERIRGKRKTCGANSVAIFLERADNGERSECRLEKAALVEYTSDTLTVFSPGYRELYPDEMFVMNEWEKVTGSDRYQKDLKIDLYTDTSKTYWEEQRFFKDRNMEHLLGHDWKAGCIMDMNRYRSGDPKCIKDQSIRGEISLQYAVTRN